MSEIQETDKLMRIMAIISGIIALAESVLQLFNIGILPYSFGWIGSLIGIICSIVIIFLGIRPIHYTPVILGILGVFLIILAILIGGIVILLATFIGALT